MLKVLDRLKKLIKVIILFLKDEDSLVFYLMEEKAYRCLNDCFKLSIRITEEMEDLIFHLKTYREIPSIIAETEYPEFKNKKIKDILKIHRGKNMKAEELSRCEDYLLEVEEMRAVERDFIFEHAKVLTFGFSLD